MKKVSALIAGATGLALVMSGCAASGGSSSGDSTLSILSIYTPSLPQYAALENAAAAFEKKTGVKVELTTSAQDAVVGQYESSVLAGQEPDLININPVGPVRSWVENGAAVDVASYIKEWGLADRIVPAAVDQWTVDGQVVGFPYETFQWPMWFNTALLAQVGVDEIPTTFEELSAAADKLIAAGITPISMGGGDWTGADFVQKMMMLYLPFEDYASVFTDGKYCSNDHVIDALDSLVAFRDRGMFSASAEGLTAPDQYTEFFTGQAAMTLAGSWAFASAPPELIDSIALGGIPMPDSGAAVERPAFSVGYTSAGFMVSPNGAKKLDLVKQFIDILYSDDVVADFVQTAAFIPAVDPVPVPGDDQALLKKVTGAIGETDRLYPADSFIPASVGAGYIQATALAFTPGKSAQDVCAALEAVYTNAG